jgi:CBS-domain-containing membrane protein
MQHIETLWRAGGSGPALVRDVMSREVRWCRAWDTLEHAARLMWEHDCGALPVVDDHGRPIGMITDRDICMAAYTQGRSLSQIQVSVAASRCLHFVRPGAPLDLACAEMRAQRVRRLAVIDVGGNLIGVVSFSDIARCACRLDRESIDSGAVVAVVADVSRPSRPPPTPPRAD